MNDEQKAFITSFYRNKLNGSTNPLFLNGPRQLDDQTDEDIYLAIRLLRKDEAGKIKEKDYAVIQLPVGEFRTLHPTTRIGRKDLSNVS